MSDEVLRSASLGAVRSVLGGVVDCRGAGLAPTLPSAQDVSDTHSKGVIQSCDPMLRLNGGTQVTGSLRLTDNGVEALATACPRLERVDVSGCANITR